MQIVIELNEELYDYMKSLPFNTILETIVLNGTPLPKGHGDLIDKDKLYRYIKEMCNQYGKPTIDYESGKSIMELIKNMSVIIEADKESDTDV